MAVRVDSPEGGFLCVPSGDGFVINTVQCRVMKDKDGKPVVTPRAWMSFEFLSKGLFLVDLGSSEGTVSKKTEPPGKCISWAEANAMKLQPGPSPHPAADDEINGWIQDLRVDIGLEDEEDEVEVVENEPPRRILPPPPPPPPPPPRVPVLPPPEPPSVPERPVKRRRTSDSLPCLNRRCLSLLL
eukprot:s1422_g6.t1